MLGVKDCYGEPKLNKYEILLFELLLCYKIQLIAEKIVKSKAYRVHIEKLY